MYRPSCGLNVCTCIHIFAYIMSRVNTCLVSHINTRQVIKLALNIKMIVHAINVDFLLSATKKSFDRILAF